MNRVPHGIIRGPMTAAERTLLAELIDRGLTPGAIALRLNRHPSTINYAMAVIMGGRALSRHRFLAPYVRNGRPVFPFDDDEDALLEAERLAGHSLRAICAIIQQRFGRKRLPATLSVRLRQLATLDDEEQAA